MDLQSIASVAAGITGAFSLVGFVVYAIVHITSKSIDRPYLTPEVIGALKNTGLDPAVAKGMTPKRVRDWLESHNALTEKIIAELAAPEIKRRGSLILYVSIGLLGLALVLGVLAVIVPNYGTASTPSRTAEPDVSLNIERNVGGDVRLAGRDYIEGITAERSISEVTEKLGELLAQLVRENADRLHEAEDRSRREACARAALDIDHAMTLLRIKPTPWESVIEKLTRAIDARCGDAILDAFALLLRGVAFSSVDDRTELGINDLSAVIQMEDLPPFAMALAHLARGIAYGNMVPPRIDAERNDYTAAIEAIGAPIEIQAHALLGRGMSYELLEGAPYDEAITDFSAVIALADAPTELRVMALQIRAMTYARLDPPRLREAIADDTAIIQMADATARDRVGALFHRGACYGRLDPPLQEQEIADYSRVLEDPVTPLDLRAITLINRGLTYRQLDRPRWEAALADHTAVIEMRDIPSEYRAVAYIARANTFGLLNPPRLQEKIADCTSVIEMPDAPPSELAKALYNRGITYGKLKPPRIDESIADLERALETRALPPDTHEQVIKLIAAVRSAE